MNKEKPTKFLVTITPSVSVNEILDLPYYGKNYDLETSIDPIWFKQIKVIDDHNLNCTYFSLDFTVKDTVVEVHDCFLPDLLWVLEDLGNKTNRQFSVNTPELTFWYGNDEEHFCSCRVINNNFIINDSNPNAETLQSILSKLNNDILCIDSSLNAEIKIEPNTRSPQESVKWNKDDSLDIKKQNAHKIAVLRGGVIGLLADGDLYIASKLDDPVETYNKIIEDIINEMDMDHTMDIVTEENIKPVEQVTKNILEPPERKYKKIKLDYDDFTRC
ncbi:MAG: hypothetical protein Terrestrivirus3_22 [Terrestrivirus sp.]|uniref:Uncharacterized protein n=1 Tax=Terrestrivirus sp. TaxID=2487775 RepID=A0A3G4ZQ66_9VIRU|nr:MAG: hypothetical protein Terrestrivirus3_22 [Terrestrivirus sp.]